MFLQPRFADSDSEPAAHQRQYVRLPALQKPSAPSLQHSWALPCACSAQ